MAAPEQWPLLAERKPSVEKHSKQDGWLCSLCCGRNCLGSWEGTCPVKQLTTGGLDSENKAFYSWSAKRAVQNQLGLPWTCQRTKVKGHYWLWLNRKLQWFSTTGTSVLANSFFSIKVLFLEYLPVNMNTHKGHGVVTLLCCTYTPKKRVKNPSVKYLSWQKAVFSAW